MCIEEEKEENVVEEWEYPFLHYMNIHSPYCPVKPRLWVAMPQLS